MPIVLEARMPEVLRPHGELLLSLSGKIQKAGPGAGQENDKGMNCPLHGVPMVQRESKHGFFWACPTYDESWCEYLVGAHKNTGEPLGKPADKATRQARIEAHNAFDKRWKGKGRKARTEAYNWLRACLSMTDDECHIGNFDMETCERVIELCE